MKRTYDFESERLGFRRWINEDKIPFSELNANQDVMEYFPNTLTLEESNAFIDRIEEHFGKYGYGLWAVEIKETNEFIGYIGFYSAKFKANFTPCVEIGWRIDKKYWNRGYATEGAKVCLEYGFEKLKLTKIYSFTSLLNKKSINVMKKIGLKKDQEFYHPNLDENSQLRLHVAYFLEKDNYIKSSNYR